MSLGQNIHELRVKNGMTQKQLADKLFVTAQAVSRWEKDEVEPSITVLNSMAEIFNVSINVIVNGLESEKETVLELEEEKEETPKIPLTTCHDCKVPIYEGDQMYKLERYHYVSHGRTHRRVSEVVTLCNGCYRKQIDADRKKAEQEEEYKRKQKHKKRCLSYGFSIAAGVIAFILFMIIGFKAFDVKNVGIFILSAFLFMYGVFSFVYCLILGTYICDVFSKVLEIGFVKFPGIIFSFSLDGFAFLIVMKILFWILGGILAIIGFLLAFMICIPLSMVTYPFYIKKIPD